MVVVVTEGIGSSDCVCGGDIGSASDGVCDGDIGNAS